MICLHIHVMLNLSAWVNPFSPNRATKRASVCSCVLTAL